MKYLFPIFLLLFSVASFSSCSKGDAPEPEDPKAIIYGSWQLTEEKITRDGEVHINPVEEEGAVVWTFNEGMELISTWPGEDGMKTEKGRYSLLANEDGVLDFIAIQIAEDRDRLDCGVDELTTTTLVISYGTVDDGQFQGATTLTFKKIEP